MKKLLVGVAVILFAFSCSKDEKDSFVFEKTASERMNANSKEFFDHLNTSNWIMEFFPARDQKHGGFAIFAEFERNYTVKLKNELGEDSDKETSYGIVERSGTTLSFNEFNKGIHYFSTPSAGRGNHRGLEGDYEFVYMKREADTLFTLGARTRNNIRFIKFLGSPDEYMNQIDKTKGVLKDKVFMLSKPSSKKFKMVIKNKSFELYEEGKDPVITSLVHRPNGFRLYKPVKIEEIEFSELVISQDKKSIATKRGSIKMDLREPLIDFTKGYSISVNEVNVSKTFLNLFKRVEQVNTATFPKFGLNKQISFGSYEKKFSIIFIVEMTKSNLDVAHNLDYKFTSPEEMSFKLTSPTFFWRYFGHLNPLTKAIESKSPYKITKKSDGDYLLTSKVDSNFWFSLKRK